MAAMSPNKLPVHYRALRFPFLVGAIVTDLVTERQVAAHTEDLSACGCFIETITPFAAETKVRLQISHGGQQLIVQGRVVYSRPSVGMGIAFTSFEPESLAILDQWLEDLRKQ